MFFWVRNKSAVGGHKADLEALKKEFHDAKEEMQKDAARALNEAYEKLVKEQSINQRKINQLQEAHDKDKNQWLNIKNEQAEMIKMYQEMSETDRSMIMTQHEMINGEQKRFEDAHKEIIAKLAAGQQRVLGDAHKETIAELIAERFAHCETIKELSAQREQHTKIITEAKQMLHKWEENYTTMKGNLIAEKEAHSKTQKQLNEFLDKENNRSGQPQPSNPWAQHLDWRPAKDPVIKKDTVVKEEPIVKKGKGKKQK